MNLLNNKVAVITGGNSGIGQATAELFATEGASVVIGDLKKEGADFNSVSEKINKGGGKAIAVPTDVTSVKDCENLFKTAFEKFGKTDILVTSAGILDYNASILKTERYLWDRMIAVNQTGLFYCCREALKYMEKQGSGSIVNISSVAGISGNAGFSYSASKHAVVAITKNIAIQYTGTNIRCNVICPGPVNTPMSNPNPEVLKQAEAYYDAEFMEISGRHINSTPGFSEPADQANAILFFASDMSRAVTGQWLQVDKGFY